jgi:GT2 family glycosyltransferase
MIGLLAVPTLTRHDLLRRMLGTVDVEVERLLIVDNSGDGFDVPDGTWKQATVLRMPINFGVAASWNLAIKCGFDLPWVMIVSDDCWFEPGQLEAFATSARQDAIVTSSSFPRWHAFAFGLDVAEKVGLFDERFYPAFYEDTEMTRRCSKANVEILTSGVRVPHENSSTLRSRPEFERANSSTFISNRELFEANVEGHWQPSRWRANRWV